MSKLTPEQRADLAKEAANARWKNAQPGSPIANRNNSLMSIMGVRAGTPKQASLDLGIERQIEIDGVGMGVLSDGTPFLTGRGLARLCGVHNSVIFDLSSGWTEEPTKARVKSIKDLLLQRGITAEFPYLAIKQRSGTFFAYPDALCLAVLEYYAFDAGSNVKDVAQKNYRLLAGTALRNFIYTQVGYDPNYIVPDAWRQFHDRVSLTYNSCPRGYFGIFKEMADMIVTLGQAGLQINSKFVPDIGVGRHWAKHWMANSGEEKYGQRIQFEHNYPNYFPQARSNPQDSWCYPDSALGEFRRWLRDDYIGQGKFAKYITDKVRHQELPASFAQLAIAAYGEEGEL
ncbi:MAG: hypothetical protein ACRD8O_12575 [Bryobacteraceae bacterium]